LPGKDQLERWRELAAAHDLLARAGPSRDPCRRPLPRRPPPRVRQRELETLLPPGERRARVLGGADAVAEEPVARSPVVDELHPRGTAAERHPRTRVLLGAARELGGEPFTEHRMFEARREAEPDPGSELSRADREAE